MSRVTRLFQRAGSPLIQGESRSQDPWWKPFAFGAISSVAVPLLVAWITRVWVGGPMLPAAKDVLAEWSTRIVWLVVGATGGSALGTSIGRGWGAARVWMPATVLGIGTAYGLAAVVGMTFS
ncbi:MAG: hypothetical protein OEV43_07415 [Coriobacteriia bacterium]|nr:hypothetical protein [Coriobacteriia bacterium]